MHIILIIIVAMGLSAKSGMPGGEVKLLIDGGVERMGGHTTYHIGPIGFGSNGSGESELDFPLDVFMGNLKVTIGGEYRDGGLWSAELEVAKNINGPGNSMKDSDWMSFGHYGAPRKVSFTESDAQLDALILDMNGGISFLVQPNFTLKGLLGYRYQNFSYEIFGVRGWQLNQNLERVYYSGYQDVNVLDYKVSYYQPYLGLLTSIKNLSSTISVDAKFAFSPIALATDHDDHILRNKQMKGSCRGNSFIGKLTAIWIPRQAKSRLSWSVKAGLEFVGIKTSGEQDQNWYGDDPLTEEDDTGLRLRGISERITNRSERILLQIGCQF